MGVIIKDVVNLVNVVFLMVFCVIVDSLRISEKIK